MAIGALVRIYLFPIRLGGPRRTANISYVPPEARAALDQITGTLQCFTREGLVDQPQIIPEYRGISFVPTRIDMHATRSGQGGRFPPEHRNMVMANMARTPPAQASSMRRVRRFFQSSTTGMRMLQLPSQSTARS